MTRKTTKIKKNKDNIDAPVSTTELKQWLVGILEFQPDTWAPNAEQWSTIKNKIFALRETMPVAEPQLSNQQHDAQTVQTVPMQPIPMRPRSMLNVEPNSNSRLEGGLDDLSGVTFPQLSEQEYAAKLLMVQTNGNSPGSPKPSTDINTTYE